MTVDQLGMMHAAASVDKRKMAAVGYGNAQAQPHKRIGSISHLFSRKQDIEALARNRGHENFLLAMSVRLDKRAPSLRRRRSVLLRT